jgi:hypothetical protein
LIGYFDDDGELSTGNYILINSYGGFNVGDCVRKNRKRRCRFTAYMTDGTEMKWERS